MTLLAPSLSAFLREHLPRERGASQHTIASYAHCYRLLLTFAAERRKTRPSRLGIEDLDATLICAFLDHLEAERANSAKSRNARLRQSIRCSGSLSIARPPAWGRPDGSTRSR